MVYLVDCENVGAKPFDVADTDKVLYFVPHKTYASDKLKSETKIVTNHNGKHDALDFCLDSYLGYLIGQGEKNLCIISCDTGFDNVVNFWKQRNINVSRVKQSPTKRVESKNEAYYEALIERLPNKKRKVLKRLCVDYFNAKNKKLNKFTKVIDSCCGNKLTESEKKELASYIFYQYLK